MATVDISKTYGQVVLEVLAEPEFACCKDKIHVWEYPSSWTKDPKLKLWVDLQYYYINLRTFDVDIIFYGIYGSSDARNTVAIFSKTIPEFRGQIRKFIQNTYTFMCAKNRVILEENNKMLKDIMKKLNESTPIGKESAISNTLKDLRETIDSLENKDQDFLQEYTESDFKPVRLSLKTRAGKSLQE